MRSARAASTSMLDPYSLGTTPILAPAGSRQAISKLAKAALAEWWKLRSSASSPGPIRLTSLARVAWSPLPASTSAAYAPSALSRSRYAASAAIVARLGRAAPAESR
ncbi:hypothetical protein CcI6DRAFT_03615 [Frankia sp. CcI6]|nr:hypothetical protein CcI6DRAFT_03615 [Frankia sp. CcI6]